MESTVRTKLMTTIAKYSVPCRTTDNFSERDGHASRPQSRLYVQVASNDCFRVSKHAGFIAPVFGRELGSRMLPAHGGVLPHMDLRSCTFKGHLVHSQLHEVDATPVFGIEVFDRQRIRNIIGVESMSLVSDDYEHSLGAFAAATDVNELAGVQAIAVEYRVSQGFPKGEFNVFLVSENTSRSSYQAHEPVH